MKSSGLSLTLGLLLSCGPNKGTGSFDQTSVTCYRQSEDYQVCEGDVDSDLISGFIKIYANKSEALDGPSLFLCGGDLSVRLGNLLHNSLVSSQTENNLFCLEADKNNIDWWWDSGCGLYLHWETIDILITFPECKYDSYPCSYNADLEYL